MAVLERMKNKTVTISLVPAFACALPGLWLAGLFPGLRAFNAWALLAFTWGLYALLLLAGETGGSISSGSPTGSGGSASSSRYRRILALAGGFFSRLAILAVAGFQLYRGWVGFKSPAAAGISSQVSGAAIAGVTVFLGVSAFGAFVFAKYAMSRDKTEYPDFYRLSYPALALTWGAIAAIVALLASLKGYGAPDLWVSRILLGFLVVWGVEGALYVFWSLIRPREHAGVGGSRSVSLVPCRSFALFFRRANPFRGFSEALDEELGIRLSGTWSYRLVRRTFAPLLLFGILVLLLTSMVIIVKPHEEAVIERWGEPVGEGALGPGLHIKAPWPVDRARLVPVSRFRMSHIGYRRDLADPVLMWDFKHYEGEEEFLLGGGNEIVTVGVMIIYKISDLRHYLYNHADPDAALLQGAYELILVETSRNTIIDFLTSSRGDLGERMRTGLQEKADDLQLGFEVIFVGFKDIHPPVEVAGAFQNVVSAKEEKDAIVRRARVEAVKLIPAAEARAARLEAEALGAAAIRTETAEGEAERFLSRIESYRAGPRIYRTRVYLDNLEVLLGTPDKIILDKDMGGGDYYIDLRPFSSARKRGFD